MNKKIALIGLVVFIIGIALLAAGSYETLSNTHTAATYTQYSAGKYISNELVLDQNATLTIVNSAPSMGVVRSAVMPSVTNSTLASVSVKPFATALGAQVYELPAGSYYVVYFGNSTPTAHYSYVYSSTVRLFGLLTSSGLFIAIAGGIVGIVGVVLKSKPKQQPPPY